MALRCAQNCCSRVTEVPRPLILTVWLTTGGVPQAISWRGRDLEQAGATYVPGLVLPSATAAGASVDIANQRIDDG